MRELLLCAPDYYGIEYEINPWMSRARGAKTDLAKAQWQGLHKTLTSLEAKVELVPPQPKLPDMVFTANAGLTVGQKFIPSNFRHQERAGEAPYFVQWMKEHGYEILALPENLYFEGEGDALFGGEAALFCGYKFRSDIQSHRAV
ncbi:MAG: amidinotransferase, partial [Verrucomicrobia bacterium]